jgi:NAD(P)-dependent dehydrogenase (short-subunit alcohol dehydrogenase family)
MNRLANKVALVTGSAGGIGRGIALKFAQEGAKVGVLDLSLPACQEVVDDIFRLGGEAIALEADITREADVETAVKQLRDAFGSINVLVNNAAVMPSGRLHETDPIAFDRCLDVNLRGTFLVSRAVLPDMLARGQGSIIHMASVTAILGLPGVAAYSATKGALVALARAMSTDYARFGVRTNTVSPGTIDSPMLHDFIANQSDPAYFRQAFDEMHPIGRVGTIDEVANVFVFLASDESSFVTGANYEVEGGLGVKGEQPQDDPN